MVRENNQSNQMLVEIPEFVRDVLLPEPENLNFYRLYKNRIIYVMGDISDWILEISKMIQIANIEDTGKPVEERTPVKLFIFSVGGEDQPTWNIVDYIAASKTPVWTINAGMCMSNGLTILVSGHKRFALKHSSGMYHSGSVGLQGTKEQVDSATKYVSSQDKMYEKWFMEHCNIDQKLFNRKKKFDWYLNADEMLEYGMVDKIIDTLDEVM